MEDLIDKRNFKEMCSRSIVKGYNVCYTSKEELEAQEAVKRMAEEKKRKEEETREMARWGMGKSRKPEPPSAHYGEKRTEDRLTQEQIEKILGEQQDRRNNVVPKETFGGR